MCAIWQPLDIWSVNGGSKLGQLAAVTALKLRVASPNDEAGIAHVCLMTADSGKDASALYSRADLPALIWATPYLQYSPQNCFVVVQNENVVGFIVATPNTRRFEQWQRINWWPKVETKLKDFRPQTERDHAAPSAIQSMKQPAPEYADQYPAHLHINLLPEVQGTGYGRRLMMSALDKLKVERVSGVHLGVAEQNTNAIGFYNALGFTQIEQSGAVILAKSL